MKKIMHKILAVALLATSSALMAAPLATLDQIQGNVVIERNGSMIPATTGMQLKQGDSIRALDNGMAVVKFNNCEVAMASHTFFSVDQAQQCAAYIEKIGIGSVDASNEMNYYAYRAAIFLGFLAALKLESENDDNTPASPQ